MADQPLTKVLIADGYPIIGITVARQLLSVLDESKFLVDTVIDSDGLLQSSESFPCDYLIVDFRTLGKLNGMTLLRAILETRPQLRILLFTEDSHPCIALAALELGVRAFVLKSSDVSELIKAMVEVLQGNTYVDRSMDVLSARKHPWYRLTASERDVMLALARGERLPFIAWHRHRSYKTITAHKYHALYKLGLKSKDEIGRYLEACGLDYLYK
ncbi:response regulator transcription factor [Lysobacter antibioticus]|uniref:response regulator transcription factor n=1 Tax=Lysobacter antibioticus TaxID=84531 RepID=UPI0009A2442A|nr:response regulator transcription factor [Lysobacter antibioticus]